jgi:hypothetical protein
MGRKSEPSITSGGIGITQEITSVGGMNVSGGIEVDITPVDFGVTVDSSEGTVLVAGGAEVPGGLIGISGGIEIDLNTGQVTGGSIGGEVGGLGINLSNSKKGGLGIEFTVQIPGTPIELSLGFGFPPKKEDPTPTPTPTLPPGSESPFRENWQRPLLPAGDPNKHCILVLAYDIRYTSWYHNGSLYYDYQEIDSGEFNSVTGVASAKKETTSLNPPREIRQLAPQFFNGTLSLRNARGFVFGFPGVTGTTLLLNSGVYHGILELISGKEDKLFDFLNRSTEVHYERIQEATYNLYKIRRNKTYKIIHSSCNLPSEIEPPNSNPPPQPLRSPFPNSPPRRQKKMDACCRENLKFLRAIYTQLGLFKFPGQLPATIIQEVTKEGEELAEPPQVPIFTLVDLLQWQFERDDERWGQWQVQINVKDSDITQEGDQSKQVKFPNLAESIAEIEGQILSLTANVDALVAISTKNLVESGLGRQEAIKGYLASKAIIKYMAFKTTEIDVEIPACFTTEAETIAELVKESTIHLKGLDYTEKETLRDILLDLLQAAAIIRAVHWQRIDTKKDTKTQLLELLKNSASLASLVKTPTTGNNTQPNPTQDFEDFIDTVEDGFRNVTGVVDPENPYGKTPNRRPRIRQIGENISQAGKN